MGGVLVFCKAAKADFSSNGTYVTGGNAEIAFGDYDNDGDVDIASCGLSVWKNNGSGVFSESFNIINGCNGLKWGDYDRDGDLDLLIGTNNGVRVYKNNGGDSFSYSWGGQPGGGWVWAPEWIDLDGDGDLDIFAGVYSGLAYSYYYRNDGTDAFSGIPSGGSITAGVTSAKAMDFDLDGYTDLLLGFDNSSVRVFKNPGPFGPSDFTQFFASAETAYIQEVDWGDIDGDGDLDILAANDLNVNRIYKFNGTTYALTLSSVENEKSFGGKLVDVDNDGDLDQVIGNDLGGGSIPSRIYLNDGLGGYAVSDSFPIVDNVRSIDLADLDGDGDLDAALSGGSLRIFQNNIDIGNASPSVPAVTAEPDDNNITLGRVKLEWGAATDSQTPTSLITYNLRIGTCSNCSDILAHNLTTGAGNVGQATSFSIALSAGPTGEVTYYWSVQAVDSVYSRSAFAAEDSFIVRTFSGMGNQTQCNSGENVLGDYDGDGDLDQVGVSAGSGNVAVCKNTGGVFSIAASFINTGYFDTGVDFGDYDRDGDLDILVAYDGDTVGEMAFNRLYRNNGGDNFSLVWQSIEQYHSHDGRFFDFNNDGLLDIVFSQSDQFSNPFMTVYKNEGVFNAFTPVHTVSGCATPWIDIGDIDKDGWQDVLCSRYYYRNNAGASLSLNFTFPTGSSSDLVDIDQDGDLDVATMQDPGATISIYKNDGDGGFTFAFDVAPITYCGYRVSFGDFDSDGYPDLLLACGVNGTSGNNRVYKNIAGNSFSLVWQSPDAMGALDVEWVDIDQDGDLDITTSCIWACAGQYYYRNNLNSSDFSPNPPGPSPEPDGYSGSFVLTWGAGSDTETPASGLVYELRIGTSSGGSNVFNGIYPLSGISGLSKTIQLGAGAGSQTYFWSARTVDSTGRVSTWSVEDSFVVSQLDTTPPGTPINPVDSGLTTNSFSSLYATWFSATDEGSGIAGYILSIGTTPGGGDTYASQSVGLTTSATITGLSLVHGQTYFISVAAVNGVGLTGSSITTNGIQAVDITAPTAAGSLTDTGATTTNLTQLTANWTAATDAESGVTGYVLSIGTTPGGSNTYASQSVGLTTSATITGLTLAVGQTYYISVAAIDGAGLTGSAVTTDGIQAVDSTPPTAAGSLTDAGATTTTLTQLAASWTAATDAESGVTGYVVSIGTTPGASNTYASQSVGLTTSATITGLSLTVGQTYYVSVAAINGAGLTGSAVTTDGIQAVDSTPPTAAGSLTDAGGTTTTLTQLVANWTAATDAESGITGYVLSIGTTPGGSNTYASQSVGLTTSATITGLTLTVGQTYYISVAAVNGAGLTGSAVTTDGIQAVDSTPPTAAGSLTDAGATTTTLTQLVANWTAATDAESGVTGYVLSIGTTPGGSNTYASQSVGLTTSATITGLSLTVGQTYYISVAAVNGAGLTGSAVTTDGIQAQATPDTTPPSTASSLQGVGGNTTTSTNMLSASWTAATDGESGIAGYVVSIGTTPGGSDTYASQSVGLTTSATITGLSLTVGQTYYFSVAAVNGQGLTGSPVVGTGITVVAPTDTTAPGAVGSLALTGGGSSYTTGTNLAVNWTAATDTESGVSGYSVSVVLADGTVLSSSTVTGASATFTGLSLTAGQTFTVQVQAINGDGLLGAVQSTATITAVAPTDTTAPGAVGSLALTGGGTSYTVGTSLAVSWTAATDTESGVSGYSVSVVLANGTVLSSSTVTGSSATFTGMSLTAGQTFTVQVQAINGDGLLGAVQSTATITAVAPTDTTVPGTVGSLALTGGGSSYTTGTSLAVNWTAATDAESGVSSYSVSVVLANGTVLSSSMVTGTSVSFTSFSPSPAAGQTIFVQIQPINGDGLLGTLQTTSAIAVAAPTDITPPGAASGVALSGGVTTVTAGQPLAVAWAAASDGESGITGYSVSVLAQDGTVLATVQVSGSPAIFSNITLTPGQTVTVQVQAINGDGLLGDVAQSAAITVVAPVDTTPPGGVVAISLSGSATSYTIGGPLTLTWEAASDAESTITGYSVSVVLADGTVVSASFVTGTTATFTGLILADGQTFRVLIQAQNSDGLLGPVQSSVEITAHRPADTTPPPTVGGVNSGGGGTSTSLTSLTVAWDAVTDGESGIAFYSLSIRTTEGITLSASQSTTSPFTFEGLSLTVGVTYQVVIQAVNGDGLASEPVVFDINIVTPGCSLTLGDLNGDCKITLEDAQIALDAASGLKPLAEFQVPRATITGSPPESGANASLEDANLILRCADGDLAGLTGYGWCQP